MVVSLAICQIVFLTVGQPEPDQASRDETTGGHRLLSKHRAKSFRRNAVDAQGHLSPLKIKPFLSYPFIFPGRGEVAAAIVSSEIRA
jgi:hypothetical protein